MQYQKRGLIEIVEANVVSYDKTGHIVQNVGHPEDRWFIDAETFERTYGQVQDTFGDFGWAIRRLQSGARVMRRGWNGKGMWLVLQKPDEHSKMTLPYVYIEYPEGHSAYPNGSRVPWLASQSDMLADDWEEFTEGQ